MPLLPLLLTTSLVLAPSLLLTSPPPRSIAQTLPAADREAALAEANRLDEQVVRLYQAGNYAEAVPLAQQSLAIRERLLGPTHPDVATSLNNLAALYRAQGRYGDAEPLYRRSLSIREQQLGPTHPAVATSLNNLAGLYQDQGRYGDAEPLYRRSLSIREQQLGPTHPAVATSLNNLALLYRDQGRYGDAEPLYRRSLTILEQQLGPTHPAVATSLNNLAGLYQDQGRYGDAEPLYRRSLSIREQQLGPTHPAVATSLNNLALLYQDQGRYGDAEPLYRRSLTILEQQLGSTHPDVATSLNNLALLYQDQGRYGDAEPLYRRSLSIREQQLGPTHPAVATSLNNLAGLYRDQGRYGDAEPLYRRSLTIREQQLGPTHPDVAASLNNLAALYREQGRYGDAEPLFRRSLSIREQQLGPTHPDVATSLNNLAGLYQDQGRYGDAEPLFRRSLSIREQQLGPTHPAVATSLNNLAGLYQDQGRYGDAEPLYRRSLTILEQQLGPTHPAVATSLNNLALLYRDQGRYGDAEPLYRRSLTIREQQLGPTHPDVATSLNNLAALYQDQGRYSDAEPLYRRSLSINEQQLGPTHPDVARSLNNLALLYQVQGRYGDAEPLFRRSLSISEQQLGPTHPHVAQSLNNLALLYQVQGNLPQSLAMLQRGMAIQETNLALNLAIGSETQKQAYMATLSGTTDFALSLHLQAAPTNPEAARLALTTVLRRKGRVLDAVTDSFQRLRENLTPPDQALLDELARVQSQRARLFYGGLGTQTPEQYRANLVALERQATELESQLARRSAEFRAETQPVEIAAVQAQIPRDAALVELVRYRPFNPTAQPNERFGNPRYAAYVLHSQGEPQWVDLGDAAEIDQRVAQFRGELRSRQGDVQQPGRALDAKLMQPIRPLLRQATHLLLSPDSQLNLIPFAALVDEQGKYLVERYLITHLGSGRDLLRLQNTVASQQPPLLLGDPNYNTAAATAVASTTRGTPQRSVDFAELKFGPLPGTADELQAIAPLLRRPIVLTEAAATENALKQANAPRLLHIATHGFFLEDVDCTAVPASHGGTSLVESTLPIPVCRPTARNLENPLLRSGLALAGFNTRQSASEDGVLTAAEVAQLRLRGTQLVVLSACETGLGMVANGEGVYGLRRAFAIAGAESQVMSLWKVDDAGTAQLMTSYYERLKRGEGRSQALRSAQREFLQTQEFRAPYYWAAFVFAGEWSAMEGL